LELQESNNIPNPATKITLLVRLIFIKDNI
jgi:hypothetical protein